ncbi:hypothetical protein TI04_10520 [Achromatium sp. WMS2]|nr:hypothetical protein TI04_10520 [Achromatium sp. WMS2]
MQKQFTGIIIENCVQRMFQNVIIDMLGLDTRANQSFRWFIFKKNIGLRYKARFAKPSPFSIIAFTAYPTDTVRFAMSCGISLSIKLLRSSSSRIPAIALGDQ